MPTSLDSVAHAIADHTRRGILDHLRDSGPQRAGDIAARFARISRPAVSKHLRVLRGSRLILQERRGRELWYRLDPTPLTQVETWLQKYSAFWRSKLEDLKITAEK